MNVKQAIERRQSCRSFDKSKLVEMDKLQQIVQAGVLSPSARNLQPWHLTVLQGDKAKQVTDICQTGGANAFLSECNTVIVVSMLDAVEGKRPEGVTPQDFRPMDIGMCVMQMCLQATELGVDSCIIGWLNSQQISKVINSDNHVALVVALGYPTKDYEVRAKKRRDFNQSVTFMV